MNDLLTDIAFAVLLGGAAASGALLLLSLLPRLRAQPLALRIAPYIRDVTLPNGRDLPEKYAHPLGIDILALARRLSARLVPASGGGEPLESRIDRAGWEMNGGRFRALRRLAALGGLAIGGLAMIVAGLSGRFSPLSLLAPPALALGGTMVCDALLAAAVRARARRMEEELPTVLEFLALCLSAGAGLFESVQRVGAVGSGELGGELRRVVLAVRTGDTLGDALEAMARRAALPSLTRAVDHLVVAIDRGAPLAHVLHAQAEDARDSAKRALLESAGRKEIYMLLPLVFLILPLSILFAVFPGVAMLGLGPP